MQKTKSKQKHVKINLIWSSKLSQKWWRWWIQLRWRLFIIWGRNLVTKSKRASKSNRNSKWRAIRKSTKTIRSGPTISSRRSETNPNNKWRSARNKSKLRITIKRKSLGNKFKKNSKSKTTINNKIHINKTIIIKPILQQTNKHSLSSMTIRTTPDSNLRTTTIWAKPQPMYIRLMPAVCLVLIQTVISLTDLLTNRK